MSQRSLEGVKRKNISMSQKNIFLNPKAKVILPPIKYTFTNDYYKSLLKNRANRKLFDSKGQKMKKDFIHTNPKTLNEFAKHSKSPKEFKNIIIFEEKQHRKRINKNESNFNSISTNYKEIKPMELKIKKFKIKKTEEEVKEIPNENKKEEENVNKEIEIETKEKEIEPQQLKEEEEEKKEISTEKQNEEKQDEIELNDKEDINAINQNDMNDILDYINSLDYEKYSRDMEIKEALQLLKNKMEQDKEKKMQEDQKIEIINDTKKEKEIKEEEPTKVDLKKIPSKEPIINKKEEEKKQEIQKFKIAEKISKNKKLKTVHSTLSVRKILQREGLDEPKNIDPLRINVIEKNLPIEEKTVEQQLPFLHSIPII